MRIAKITKSYVPLSVAAVGAVATGLAVQVADIVASTSGSNFQRWSADAVIAIFGLSLSFFFSRGLDRFIEKYLKSEERAKFLGAFSEFLSRSFDFETGIGPLASLLVPLLGDECMIDLIADNGRIRRTTSASLVTEYDLSRFAILNQNPALFDDGSGLIVPMKARDRVFGTLTLMWTERKRRYRAEDLAFLSDVARRAALALDNARLQAEAERANRLKDEFLTTLSHELRTPMNVILGWIDVLECDDENVDRESLRTILRTLHRNAKIQMQLIDDLLDVSRIANGKFVLMIKTEDLARIAREALQSVVPAARAREIELDLKIGGGSHFAAVDGDRIHQVLWNLLSNAVKFTAPGGRVEVRVENSCDTVSIAVEDTGQGIEPKFLPHVFDRFSQEDGTFTRSQGGLGIGLAIASHLVELHGGQLRAESAGRGKGSTFTIELKRVEKISEPRPVDSWIAAEI